MLLHYTGPLTSVEVVVACRFVIQVTNCSGDADLEWQYKGTALQNTSFP